MRLREIIKAFFRFRRPIRMQRLLAGGVNVAERSALGFYGYGLDLITEHGVHRERVEGREKWRSRTGLDFLTELRKFQNDREKDWLRDR